MLRLRGHFFLKAGRPKWSRDPMALSHQVLPILCENGIESMSLFLVSDQHLVFGEKEVHHLRYQRFLSEVGPRGFASTLFVSSVKLVEVQGVPTTVKVENFASLITSIRIGYSNKHPPSGFPTISIHFQLSNGFLCTKTTTSNPIIGWKTGSLDWFCWENLNRKPMGFYHQIGWA